MQITLSRGWKVRSEPEMQAWGARVLNQFFAKHPDRDPLQIQKLNEEGIWFRDRHFTYLEMLGTGEMASSARKARQVWQAFPAVRASDARPRIPLDADIARRQTEMREKYPLEAAGIDIDEEVEKSFNGRPFDALDRLERQEQLFGPDGAFLEPMLKRELKLDDGQLENLKASWMRELVRRDPSLRDKSEKAQRRALLQFFFSAWPAYREFFTGIIENPLTISLKFYHLSLDPRLSALPKTAEAVLRFVCEQYPELNARLGRRSPEHLQQALDAGLAHWEALLTSLKTESSNKQEVRNLFHFFDMTNEIQTAPPSGLRSPATPEQRIEYLRSQTPLFYHFLMEKSGGTLPDRGLDECLTKARTSWLERYPEDTRLPEEELIKRSAIHLLYQTINLHQLIETTFSFFEPVTLSALAAYTATDMHEAPPPALLASFIDLAAGLLVLPNFLTKIESYSQILLSKTDRIFISRIDAIISRARELFPDFFETEYLQHPPHLEADLSDTEFHHHISNNPQKFTVDGHEIQIPWQMFCDIGRGWPITISEEGHDPILSTVRPITGEEEGKRILYTLKTFAGGDEKLFQLLAILRCQASFNLIKDHYFSGVDKFGMLSMVRTNPIRQTILRKTAELIESTIFFDVNITDMETLAIHTIHCHATYQVIRQPNGEWFCQNPVLSRDP
jgi:hypothetical protein